MVSLDQYKKDKEEFSSHLEGQIKAMETSVKDMWSNNTTLENENKSKEKEISELKKRMDKLKNTIENGNNERAILKSEIQNLMVAKKIPEDKNGSNDKRTEEIDTKIKNLNALIEKETEARTFSNKDLEKRCSRIESNIEKVASQNSDPALENLAVNSLTETFVAEKSPIVTFGPSELREQYDLEVTSHDNISIEPNYHNNAPHSVLNNEHKTGKQTKNQQLSNNSENNITIPTDESLTPRIEVNNSFKVNEQIGKDTTANQFILDQQIIDIVFTFFETYIKELFRIINILIKNGMGWGMLLIILLLCTAAKVAPSEFNGALSPKQPNGLNNPTLPEAFSNLGAGERTTIYGATTVFTKTYIMNLGAVEEKLIETINNSHKAISAQTKICRDKPISCPITWHIKHTHEDSINKSSQILANLGLACETKSANNKGSKHLAIPGPIIFSTVMGTSSSPTSAATAHAISINEAHRFSNTKAPRRSRDNKNGTTNKPSPWTTPDKTVRHSDQALENFSADIKSIVSQNKIGLPNSNTKDVINLAKNTATVVTTLIPTNGSSAQLK